MAMATETQIPSNPSFYMIFLQDFPTRLKIPLNFVRNFGKEIPKKVTLKVGPDKSWEVDVVKGPKNLYIQKGWEIFVENNNLEHGDFLIFTYYGNSMFNVEIFGNTACEKKYFVDVDEDENSEPHVSQENQREKQIPRKEKSNEFDDAEVEKNVINIDSGLPDDDKITGKKRPKNKKRMKRNAVGQTASKWKSGNQTGFPEKAKDFSSQYPFFKVKMTPAYLTSGYLAIPSKFSRKYLQEKDVGIRVQISKRTWNLQLYTRTTSESFKVFKIGGKWTEFVRDNDLKNGDICVFEMIKSDDIDFHVYIHRC